MSEHLFQYTPEDHPGPIYNPESPFWHKVDFDNLPDTDDGLSNELAFVSAAFALWLATLGFGITWFPPDPENVCPLPAWMVADAYERLDQNRMGRPSDYWRREMEKSAIEAYGKPPGTGLDDFLKSFIHDHEN